MGKRTRRTMALPLDVNWADIDFFDERSAPKKAKTPPPAPLSPEERLKKRREKRRRERQGRRIKNYVKKLARIVAFDLLEMRAESFAENEKAWRDQQQREAKAYAAKLTAAFREAVKKEAAEKSAA